MSTLPQLVEEDIQLMDTVLNDLLSKSEATSALVLDKGGFLLTQCGDTRRFDATTLGALAAAMYAATQGIASLVSEVNFSSVYQQGENFSILVHDVDENCLLLVIFKAQISVGAVKYYALTTITQIAKQMKLAQARSPDEGLDLSVLNIADTADLFRKKKS
jgi:predicted regulator of Ras-like GTPase activity (Roadblock/LC7/MglB family)